MHAKVPFGSHNRCLRIIFGAKIRLKCPSWLEKHAQLLKCMLMCNNMQNLVPSLVVRLHCMYLFFFSPLPFKKSVHATA